MIKHGIHKRRINAERLRTYIKEKTSIRAIGREGVYNEKTIRRGLSEECMSLDLIVYLASILQVPADCFADVPFKYSIDEIMGDD